MTQAFQNLRSRLIQGLNQIPESWALTPLLGNKAPYRSSWQHEAPIKRSQLEAALLDGEMVTYTKEDGSTIQKHIFPQGYGIRTGIISGGIVAVDLDGPSAHPKMLEMSGGQELPKTVAFSSGRPGRRQYLFRVPKQYWQGIQTKKYKTGFKGDDGKPEQVEFRWDGCQSVLPPSVHPTTGQYQWVEGCTPWECESAFAPLWLLELMLKDQTVAQQQQSYVSSNQAARRHTDRWTDIDWALSYLEALSPSRSDDYDDWLAVGMALHSVDDSLLIEWDSWSRQSSKYKPGDCVSKWKSFKRTGVSIGSLAHMAKQDGWRSPFPERVSRTLSSVAKVSGHQTGSAVVATKPTVESRSLRSCVAEILERNLSASELTAALVKLSSDIGRPLREIKELADSIEADLEIEDGRNDCGSEIDRLDQIKQRSLTLDKYLPLSLAEPMTKMAQWMGAPPAAFLVALLPTVASLLDPACEIIIKECIGFIERPIIYAGIVTESGQRKSPLLNAITYPLRVLQQQEDARYLKAMLDYSQAQKTWDGKSGEEPPSSPRLPREYYIDKATMEAVDAIKQNQPNHGLLWLKDELSGLMASYGEYKGGRGADKESMLSGWNGRGVKKNLKGGDRVSLTHDAMSVLGAIQDATLQKMMGDFNDNQGDWARFLWLLIPLKALKLPESDTTFQLAMLESLYRRLDRLPAQKYRLAFDAQALYDNFHASLEQRRVAEPRRGMRAAIAKMEGYTARIALVLHVIWELESGKDTPSPYIPSERVAAAIKLTEFFLGQVELIHAEGAAASGNNLTPRLAAILDKARQFGELTARRVQAAISWLRQVSASKIRNDFKELAKLGYGVCVGAGNRLSFIPKSADSAAVRVARSADSWDSPQALNVSKFQDFDRGSADSVDETKVASGLSAASGERTENLIDEHQQCQHVSGFDSNPYLTTSVAADEVSADISAIAQPDTDAAPCKPDDQPLGNRGSQVSLPDDMSPSGDRDEQLSDEVLAAWHSRLNACLSLNDALDFYTALDTLSPQQRNQFESSVPQERWTWLWNLPEVKEPQPPEPSAVTSPTLSELKALLNACDSLVQLNDLKRKHGKTIDEAYGSMSEQEQAGVDAIAALAVPYKVFKYLGDEIRQGTERLIRGMLVYIDPQTQVRATALSALVWALDGVGSGWRKPINVSFSLMREVVKAMLPGQEQDGDQQQLGLI